MRNEFNDIPLINPDGFLQQDEWNKAVYSEYSMKALEEDSSGKFVESRQYSEFNELTYNEYSWEKKEEKKEDNSSRGKNALQSTFSSLPGTIVAALAGAFIIAGSYAAATTGSAGNVPGRIGGNPEIRWEWSADHTNADLVLASKDKEIIIPANVAVEETSYCTAEGEAFFHAKAPAEDGKYYYGEYSESVPPKGLDFEVHSFGTGDDGAVYGDFVCKICGEHFILNAEYSSEEGSQHDESGSEP